MYLYVKIVGFNSELYHTARRKQFLKISKYLTLFVCHNTGDLKKSIDQLAAVYKLTNGFTHNDKRFYGLSDFGK
jgi:hypothetical protein